MKTDCFRVRIIYSHRNLLLVQNRIQLHITCTSLAQQQLCSAKDKSLHLTDTFLTQTELTTGNAALKIILNKNTTSKS